MNLLNQDDVKQRNAAIEIACAQLHENLIAAGDSIPHGLIPSAPNLRSGDDLDYNRALLKYHADLALLLTRKTQPTATTAPAANSTSAIATAPAVSAELNKDELSALQWTERVEYAGKKLTAAECRSLIAARVACGVKIKPQTLSEKVMEAKGVTTLAELPTSQDPLD